jgi:predicted nucleic acid-binding protein
LIAIDTSSLRRWAEQEEVGDDIDMVDVAIASGEAALPPVVVTEALSKVLLPAAFVELIETLPIVAIRQGYWYRAGELRADTMRRGHKAKLADVLIAQACIDKDIALITHDADFRHFLRAGLKLA